MLESIARTIGYLELIKLVLVAYSAIVYLIYKHFYAE